MIIKAKKEYKSEYVFCTAWNEWGEGSYLEPDTTNELGYLKSVKDALDIASIELENEEFDDKK